MANGPYDVLGPYWGLGLPISWFDETAISTLLTAPLTGSSVIDQMILGWDGEDVDVWEVVRDLLRPLGYFPGYTAEGKLTFGRARLANVLDTLTATTVTPIPNTLKLVPAAGDGVDRLVATYGATPWFDGDRVEVNVFSDADALEPPNSLRAGIFADRNVLEMDMRFFAPTSLGEAATGLISFVAMRGLALSTLYIRANDPGTIDIGDIVRVGDPTLRESWFVDADGDPIQIDATARWYGQVVGFRRELMDGSIDLELVMNTEEFARVRAPSAVISSVASAVYTCEQNNFGGPLGDGTDVEQFQVGDEVEVWSQDGTRVSGTAVSPDVQVITAIGTNTITLDAAWTTAPSAGDIIRLAHLSTANGFPEADSDLVDGYLPYVYSSDDRGLMGPNDIDAHIYGLGII